MDWLHLSIYKRKESGCGADRFEAKVGVLLVSEKTVGRIDFTAIQKFIILDDDYLI